MISDSFPISEVTDSEGNKVNGMFKVKSKNVAVDDNVDIGCGNAFGGDADEGPPADVETVNNIVDSFKYQETNLGTASDLKEFLKGYFPAVVAAKKEAGVPQEQVRFIFFNSLLALYVSLYKFELTLHHLVDQRVQTRCRRYRQIFGYQLR